jgi:DNA-binding SARP family transcriptional activator/ABC-type branched-subunit amino acid transport system substrate-binding protein
VKVHLTGKVTLESNGLELPDSNFPGRQGRLLFAYLVTEQGRAIPRDELADILWGESLPATWDKALTVLISKLRTLLAEAGVEAGRALTSAFGCYRLDLPAESRVDVIEALDATRQAQRALAAGQFDDAKAAAEMAESVARKSFLPGETGDWVEAKRRELAEIRASATTALAEAHLRLGDAPSAVQWAERGVALEPFREAGYRQLMEAHRAAGNRAEALRVYEQCRGLLARELGTDPSPETESLFLSLLDAPPARPPRSPTRAPAQPSGMAVTAPAPPVSRPRRPRRRNVVILAVCLLVVAGVAVSAVQFDGRHTARLPALRTLASDHCSGLHYAGTSSPELLVAADLPLQPGALDTTTPMVQAMTLALEQRHYTAGRYRVGLQVCDDATATSSPLFDPTRCTENAQRYAEDPSVIGVVGPLVSGCALEEIPVLNRASAGPVPIVSPSATVVGLTRASTDSVRYSDLYPTERRNFARVVPADDVQAAADAMIAQQLGVSHVYVLDDGEPFGQSFVGNFVRAAHRLGVGIAGHGSWDPEQTSDSSVVAAIARIHPDSVFLGVSSSPESIQLLTDLRTRLGRAIQFMAPEVFDPATAVLAGAAAEGMTISQPGPPSNKLAGAGKQFVTSFSSEFGAQPTRFADAAAQAIDVLMDAIAHSDGSRASVTSALFATTVSNEIFGSFSITPTGDTTLNAVSINRITGGTVTPFTTVYVPDALVASN